MGHRLRARRPRGRGALQHVPTHLHAATIGRAVNLERQQDVTLVVEPAGRVQAGLLVLLSIGRDDARLAVGERGLRRGDEERSVSVHAHVTTSPGNWFRASCLVLAEEWRGPIAVGRRSSYRQYGR